MSRLRDAQRQINVMRLAVEQDLENGALVSYIPGVVASSSGYYIGAYLGASEYVTDYIDLNAGDYATIGDYVIVARLDGASWVDQVLPYTTYPKMAIDFNRGVIYLGTGSTLPMSAGAYGQVLHTGGSAGTAYYANVSSYGGGGSGVDGDDLLWEGDALDDIEVVWENGDP